MASILAVDDSEAILNLIKVVLESQGHLVFLKKNAHDALKFALIHTVDLVITDLYMPGMNGMDLVSNIRLIDNYKNKPILVMTIETSDYKKEKAKMVGATGWVTKPVDKARLLQAVRKSVD